jgi:hypothetical protein
MARFPWIISRCIHAPAAPDDLVQVCRMSAAPLDGLFDQL